MAKSPLIFTPLTDATYLMAERARIYSLATHTVMQISFMAEALAAGKSPEVVAQMGAHQLVRLFSDLYPKSQVALTEIIQCSEAGNLGITEWLDSKTEVVQ